MKKHKTNATLSDGESSSANDSVGGSIGVPLPTAPTSAMPVSTAPRTSMAPKKSLWATIVDVTDEEDEDKMMEIEVECENEATAEEDLGKNLHLIS